MLSQIPYFGLLCSCFVWTNTWVEICKIPKIHLLLPFSWLRNMLEANQMTRDSHSNGQKPSFRLENLIRCMMTLCCWCKRWNNQTSNASVEFTRTYHMDSWVLIWWSANVQWPSKIRSETWSNSLALKRKPNQRNLLLPKLRNKNQRHKRKLRDLKNSSRRKN